MKNHLSHPYAMLTLVALIWGANAVAGKLAVGDVSPMMLTVLRWIVACAVLAPFAWPHARRDWPLIRPRLPFLIALGVFGFSLFNALFYLALTYTSALNVVKPRCPTTPAAVRSVKAAAIVIAAAAVAKTRRHV